MSEPSVNVGVKVTGASEGAAALRDVGAAAKEVAPQIAQTKAAAAGLRQAATDASKAAATVADSAAAAAQRNTGAAREMARETAKVGEAATTAAKGAQQAKGALDGLSDASSGGAAAGRVLDGVLRGNIASLTGLGGALKGIAVLARANPLGAVLVVVGALAAVLQPLINRWRNFKKELEETKARQAAADLDQARAAAEKLSSARLDGLRDQLAGIEQGADAALRRLQQISALSDKLADVEMAADLAELAARTDISETDRTSEEFRIRGNASTRRRERERAAEQEQQSVLELQARLTGDRASSAAAAAAAQRGVVERQQESPRELARLLEEVVREQQEVARQLSYMTGAESEDSAGLYARSDELRNRRESLESQLSLVTGESGQEQRRRALADLREREEAEKMAAAELAKVTAQLEQFNQTLEIVERTRSQIEAAEDRLANAQFTPAVRSAQERDFRSAQDFGNSQIDRRQEDIDRQITRTALDFARGSEGLANDPRIPAAEREAASEVLDAASRVAENPSAEANRELLERAVNLLDQVIQRDASTAASIQTLGRRMQMLEQQSAAIRSTQ
jgi:DNA repair exonuclease SbcCD ATPase subunit